MEHRFTALICSQIAGVTMFWIWKVSLTYWSNTSLLDFLHPISVAVDGVKLWRCINANLPFCRMILSLNRSGLGTSWWWLKVYSTFITLYIQVINSLLIMYSHYKVWLYLKEGENHNLVFNHPLYERDFHLYPTAIF